MGSYVRPCSIKYFIFSALVPRLLLDKYNLNFCKLFGSYFIPYENYCILSIFPPKLLS